MGVVTKSLGKRNIVEGRARQVECCSSTPATPLPASVRRRLGTTSGGRNHALVRLGKLGAGGGEKGVEHDSWSRNPWFAEHPISPDPCWLAPGSVLPN